MNFHTRFSRELTGRLIRLRDMHGEFDRPMVSLNLRVCFAKPNLPLKLFTEVLDIIINQYHGKGTMKAVEELVYAPGRLQMQIKKLNYLAWWFWDIARDNDSPRLFIITKRLACYVCNPITWPPRGASFVFLNWGRIGCDITYQCRCGPHR